jgi:hypothetical protein
MRKELVDLIGDDTEIRHKELSESVRMIEKLLQLRINAINKSWEKIEKENPELVNDIMDDIVWYESIENQIIIQFGIWRLHSLFEKIMRQELLKNGIKAWSFVDILKLMHDSLSIDESLVEKVKLWGNLRHKLSHRPMDRLSFTSLKVEDLENQLKLYNDCLEKINAT